MRKVVVAGIGQTPFGKFKDRSVRSLAEEALQQALKDAGIDASRIGVVYFANALSGLITGQETIRGQVALRYTPLMGTPIINVDNACASGSSAFNLAWLSVASGASRRRACDWRGEADPRGQSRDVRRIRVGRGRRRASSPHA
jgi:acetyl-CoA acyltransferase